MELLERAFEVTGNLFNGVMRGFERGITSLFGSANALLPTLDLVAWYGASGLAGEQNVNAGLPPNSIPRSGLPNAFATLFRNDFPDYAVGFNMAGKRTPIFGKDGEMKKLASKASS